MSGLALGRRPLLLGAPALVSGAAMAQGRDRPVRLVLSVELQILDPHFGNTNPTRAFGYMVFDTLVSMDSQGRYRPQMLESWTRSEDGMRWGFTLRPGLAWHDGTPVTAEDCVASLRRWGSNDGFGRRLFAATRALRAEDARRFTLELSRPFGWVIEALGKPAAYVPFMMPARLASTPASRQVTEIVGSGPFTFNRDEWRPGERAVLRRNPNYVPRDEPADGLAGGKVPRAEVVEIVSMPDLATRVAALQTGEVDYLELVPIDYIARLRRERAITMVAPPPIAQVMGGVQVNTLQPPFNNKLARQAAQAAVDQEEILAALGLPSDMATPFCGSIFMCGGPYASEAGTRPWREGGLARARALLEQSGMKDQRVALLHSGDSALISPMTLVLADRLKQAGFNVDLQTYDYATITQRRLKQDPVEQGGWSLVPVVWTGYDLLNPLSNYGTAYSCSTAYPGWYCIPEMQPLLDRFEAESDPGRRKELADRMQALVHEEATMLFTGQFAVPAAYRTELEGVLPIGLPVMWNLRRKG